MIMILKRKKEIAKTRPLFQYFPFDIMLKSHPNNIEKKQTSEDNDNKPCS
jgi:hypothetical protein